MIKKVMILAYDYPPYISVGGLRPQNWFQNFKKNGIYPILVTRQWNNIKNDSLDYVRSGKYQNSIIEKNNFGTIIKSPFYSNISNKIILKYGNKKFKLIRKILSFYYYLLENYSFLGNKSAIFKSANSFLSKTKIDYIIATGEPYVMFKYASKLSEKYDVPWIADFRDLWVGNEGVSNLFLNYLNGRLQNKYLKNVYAITTVSENLKFQLKRHIINKNIYVVLNGFDDSISEISHVSTQNESIFSIGFMGSIYPWHPVADFFNVINKLHCEKKLRYNINFYGINKEQEIKNMLKESYPKIQHLINIYKKDNNKNICEAISKNNLLLLFNDYYLMGTKIFNYIALKRKIIFCFSEQNNEGFNNHFSSFKNENSFSKNLQIDLIKNTNSGYIIKNTNDLETQIIKLQKKFSREKRIECESKNFNFFSRKNQTKIFCDLIKGF